MKAQKLNQRQAQWTLYLSRFDFMLKHILGTKMGKADGLSGRLDWKVGVENNNDNQVFIKDNWICRVQEVVIEGPKVDILEKIKKARSKIEDVVRVVEEMKKAKVKELQGEEWKIEGDLVLKEGKIYVLKNVELRAEVIWLHYNMPAAYGVGVKITESGLSIFLFSYSYFHFLFLELKVRVSDNITQLHIHYII